MRLQQQQEVLGTDLGKLPREGHRHKNVHSQGLQARLPQQVVANLGRQALRGQHGQGMIAESIDQGLAADLSRQLHGPSDNALMPQMHAVKHTQGYKKFRIFFSQIRQLSIDFHRKQNLLILILHNDLARRHGLRAGIVIADAEEFPLRIDTQLTALTRIAAFCA